MNILETPFGVWQWDGELALDTQITVDNRQPVSFQHIVKQTNGDALNWLDEQDDLLKFRSDQRRDRMGRFAPEGDGGNGGITLNSESNFDDKIKSAQFWQGEHESKEQLKQQVVKNLTDSMNEAGVTNAEWQKAYLSLRPQNKLTLQPWDGEKYSHDIHLLRNEGNGNYTTVSLADAMSYYGVKQKQFYTVEETENVVKEFRNKAEAIQDTKMREDRVSALAELAFTESGQELLQESVVNHLVGSWAETSNDTRVRSHAIQETAKEVFNLKNAAEWKFDNDVYEPVFKQEVKEFKEYNANVLRAFVKSQYSATQALFASKGISKIVVFRGLEDRLHDSSDIVSKPVALRPLSSWSAYLEVASRFSVGGTAFSSTVDVKDIFSTPFTGLGCHNEQELVLLGGVKTVDVGPVIEFSRGN